MGRDNTGKKQEDAQLTRQNDIADKDLALRNQQIGKANQQTDALAANPGLTPEQVNQAKTANAFAQHSLTNTAADQYKRHALMTGHANDAAMPGAMAGLAQQEGLNEASGSNNVDLQNAIQGLTTRRMLPGLYMDPAQVAQQNVGSMTGASTGLIGGRMSADSQPTFLQQAALSGIGAAGNAMKFNVGSCWIAEALYGEDSKATSILRRYLNSEFKQTKIGAIVMRAYVRHGRQVASMVRTNRVVRAAMQPLFNFALNRALDHYIAEMA